ncbi:MAG: tetratricopeptide repeat protein, partial [Thermomicrobiales bacterium]
PAAQPRFAALSIFSGGFTAAAARATVGAGLPDLLEFSDKSLVRRDGTGRFTLHEVMRQYAGERLAENPDSAMAARDRHAGYYADLMANAESRLKGAEQADTLKAIDAERSNLRIAWDWLVSRRQFERIGSALDGVGLFYALRQLPEPGLQLMNMAQAALQLEREGQAEVDILKGRILGRKARFMLMLGQPLQAQEYLAAADTLLARHQAQHQLAFGLDIKGRIANMAGEFQEARRLHQLALEEAQCTEDRYGEATALNRLAGIAFDVGDFVEAGHGFAASLEVRRSIRDWEGVARELGNLGEVACETGAYQQAQEYIEESLALYRELGVEHLPARLEGLGRLSLRQGNLAEAHRRLIECQQVAQERGGYIVGATASLRLAELAILRGDLRDAHAYLRECKEVFDARKFLPNIVQWGVVRSQVALLEDQPEDALEYANQALALAEDLGDIRGHASSRGAAARAMLALGRTDEALATLHDAIELVRGTGATPLILDLAAAGICGRLATTNESNDADQLVACCRFIQIQSETWYSTRLEIDRTLLGIANSSSTTDASSPVSGLTLDVILDRMR